MKRIMKRIMKRDMKSDMKNNLALALIAWCRLPAISFATRYVLKPACLVLLTGVGLLTSGMTYADEIYLIQTPAVYAKNATVPEKIMAECKLEELVGNYAVQYISEKFPGSTSTQNPTPASAEKTLVFTILDVYAPDGGAWSGSKSMTIRAEVIQQGKTVDSVVKQRSAGGGLYGNCGLLERAAKALGKDVALWLVKPAEGLSKPARKAAANEAQQEQTAK